MEWAGRKERFGNTPENKIRPDLSKLNPGGFRFQAMVLKHHLTASPSFPKRGLHLSLVCFASKFGVALPRSENAGDPGAAAAIKFDKQPAKVWAGPLRGLQIAKQSEKARRHQSGACSDLTAPGFFVAPDGSLLAGLPVSALKLVRQVSLFCTAFFSQKKARIPKARTPSPPVCLCFLCMERFSPAHTIREVRV